jgi:hypothetical protein
MNRFAFVVLALVVPSALGCSAPTEDTDTESSSESALSSRWEKVLTCDNGAAVLDVDTSERRHLQFVIRNPQIIGYLASEVRVSTQGIISRSGEIIVGGRQDRGVWSSSDFDKIDGNVPYVNAEVRREGGGVRVAFWVNAQGAQGCFCAGGGDPCSGSLCQCPGGPEDTICPGNPHQELANWFFRNCN